MDSHYRRNIMYRLAIFWYLSREIADFSRYIGDLAINRLFLAIYRVVNAGQTRYSARQRATVPPSLLAAERI